MLTNHDVSEKPMCKYLVNLICSILRSHIPDCINIFEDIQHVYKDHNQQGFGLSEIVVPRNFPWRIHRQIP